MLAAMIMSLLTQSDYLGLQQPIRLLESGMLLPKRTRLLFARLLGGRHACGATIAGCLRRVPQKLALAAFFYRRVHRIFTFVSLYLLGATCLINPLPTRLSSSDFSLFGIGLGALITSGERRRIRLLPMAS